MRPEAASVGGLKLRLDRVRIHNAEVELQIHFSLRHVHTYFQKRNEKKECSSDSGLYWSNRMMRLWTSVLIALLSSAIAVDDFDYRQQILQAHIVAPPGQPVPFAQVDRFPLCSGVWSCLLVVHLRSKYH